MKNRMRNMVTRFLAVSMCVAMLTGCGAASQETSAMTDAAAPAAAYEEVERGHYIYGNGMPTEEIAVEEAMPEKEAVEESDSSVIPSDRKLITTMNLSVETEELDILMYNIETIVADLGGYLEQTEIWNGSAYSNNRSRSAYLVIRVPAEDLDAFVNRIAEDSNIVSQSKSVEDVTLTYVDLESHKSALETEQARLLELLEMAESMEDIIAIEDKLGEVRYELESMESQLRTYDNKINYSTIYLDISEVERLTPVQEETTWDRISNGFAESLYEVGVGIKDFIIGVIINIPYLVLWAVIIVVIVFIVLHIKKRRAKKQKQKVEMLRKLNETKLEIDEDKDGK